MQLRHLKTIMPPTDGMCKVTALAWSPNNRRLAVVTVDRVVHLFDENGERRDKFSTKPADKGPKTYIVQAMAFSPDSTKLAVAQSDNIVFVYKLGLEWGDKKSICNKFPQTSPITCLTWPSAHPNEVVFGLEEGKVKIGQLRTNKPATLYSSESYVVACCSSPDGNAILTGHVDGSIYRFCFEDGTNGPSQSKFAHHSCVPYALDWGQSIVAAGNDGRVTFYDQDGAMLRTFDYAGYGKVKEFTKAAFNPSGESVVLGNFNKFFVYNLNNRTGEWEDVGVKDVPNLYTVTALSWKQDGSKLAMGALCGIVDLYDACIRRTRYRGKFEFTYVSLSQVIVKRLASGTRIVLKSHFGCEIMKINIFQDRYLVAHTPETLLMGDLETCKLSEVPWVSGGAEKFFFDNPMVCMVFHAGQLSLIEYGRNELLGACRTEHMNPHLISVRINERPPPREELEEYAAFGGPPVTDNKKIAYLLDVLTICVLDLVSGVTTATINHDAKVDWLELNGRGNLVLFRDKRRKLHLYDIKAVKRTTLLNYCNYVQWVPGSDVVVAQNRGNLCVWYNIGAPDKVTIYQIKGDVEEIERTVGKTEVIVDEGVNTASYILDEGLIGFGTAVEDGDLDKAMTILEDLDLTAETEAMWGQLSEVALRTGNLQVAQRCAAALGDVAKARFLSKTSKIAMEAEEQFGGDGRDFWLVRARMAQLRKDLVGAETIMLDQGKVEEAIEMYQDLNKWDEAIRVAEMRGHPQAEEMRSSYFQRLLDTDQQERAAELKERENDLPTAIDLYLRAGFPAKALSVVQNRPSSYPHDTLERIASELSKAGMHDKAGSLLERLNDPQRALDAYVRGGAFRQAVELARRSFPGQVVALEQAWGDHLVAQKQVDAAINHYIEAGAHTAAINAALNSRQYGKAVQMVDETIRDAEVARPFYHRIARHYHEAGMLEEARRFYVKAGSPQEAVDMYAEAGQLAAAHKLAVSCMDESKVARLYIDQARRLEVDGKLKEAEKLYLTVNEPDLGINMYKKARKYDQMIRLVTKYRKDLLTQTHLHLAQQLEMEGNLKLAEHHYSEAGEWESAVNMYRSSDMWDEAFHVAKFKGGPAAANRVAYAWALSLGGEAGSKLLNKLGLVEQAIDYAIDSGAFEHALQLARSSMKKKLPEVHLKHALYLEDEGHFKDAEAEFVKAEKPKEAIDMYLHQRDWESATRVADSYDPSSMSDILVARAGDAAESKDHARAEGFYVDAHKPELALQMYLDARAFPDALRVAKKHLPNKTHEVNREVQRLMNAESSGEDPLATARMWESSRDFPLAINAYLNVTDKHLADVNALEEVWLRAVSLANMHDKAQFPQVAEDVARRLMGMKRFSRAADLFKQIEMWQESIDCLVRAGDWDAARQLARAVAPQYQQYVEKEYQRHLSAKGAGEEMLDTGEVDGALEIFVRKGQWDKALEVASKQGSGVYNKYAAQFVKQQVDKGDMGSVVTMLAEYGPVTSDTSIYAPLVRSLLGGTIDKAAPAAAIAAGRELLFKAVSQIRRSGSASAAEVQELEKLLMVLHYMSLRNVCAEHGLGDLNARLAIALLRYAGIVPADRAFYEAGLACRSQNWNSMGFVLSNRFVDITDAIDDQSLDMVDNSDFLNTDIPPPFKFGLPDHHYVDEDRREELREWVLTLSMDASNEQTLPTNPCSNCRSDVYEASLGCSNCSTNFPACIVSGYPIPATELVTCSACNSRAKKAAWNALLVKTGKCPWCQSSQTPVY